MSMKKPSLKFQIDIIDFQDDKEIIRTIKTLLQLSKNEDFVNSVYWDKGEKVNVNVSPKISFIISGCN